jgi:galactonate dehydratase
MKMKITKIEPILYDAGRCGVWCVVRVETDEGVTGIGESSTTEPFMAASVVARLAEWMIGRDPSRIQEVWQQAYQRYFNVRGGNLLLCAISGIEQALWDIKGKVAGLPVYELLGGAVRDRVPVYVNHMFFGGDLAYDPAAWAERAAAAVDRGFRAIKIDPYGALHDYATPAQLRHATAIVQAVRDAIGPDVELAVDSHARFAIGTAIRAGRALDGLDLLFLEEPVPPENVDALRRMRQALTVPLASGERVYTKWGFRTLLEAQAVEVIQPDVAHCGGIFEARLIAAQAESHYVQVAPHNWYGPVALAASLQLDACTPNLLIQEQPLPYEETPQQRDLLTTPLRLEDGALIVPTGAGLGITLDKEIFARYRLVR